MKIKNVLLNKHGFALVETLVVATFIVIIFGILYTSFYPLMGIYERREHYDSVDAKYSTYWIKRIIERKSYNLDRAAISTNQYVAFSCDNIKSPIASEEEKARNICKKYLDEVEVLCGDVSNTKTSVKKCSLGGAPHIYITKYTLNGAAGSNNFKSIFNGDNKPNLKRNFTPLFADYVNFLPNYIDHDGTKGNLLRVIVEYNRVKDNNNFYEYGNLEISKE